MFKKIKKELRKVPKKLITLVVVLVMISSYFTPLAKVLAESSTQELTVTFRDTNYEHGKVMYSLDDGTTWNDITSNEQNKAITVTGNNLRLKIVPNNNYSVDYAGIEMRQDDSIVGGLSSIGLESSDGYAVPSSVHSVSLTQIEFKEDVSGLNTSSKITVSISGEELEYDAQGSNDATNIFFGINNSPEMRTLSKNEVNYVTENNKIVGLNTKSAIDYDYNDEGTVTFHIKHQPGDVITSLKINNTSYNTPNTKEELIQAYSKEDSAIEFDVANVPYQETYNIEIQGRPLTEDEEFMAGFLWTYDENLNEYSDDDKILHGTLEFVKAEYNNTEYTSIEEVNQAGKLFLWNDGKRDTDDPTGEAVFPKGTVLTLRLIPDVGYQLTSFDLNGFPFEPGEEVGLYTFTVGGGPFHLGAHIIKINDEVQTNSQNVKSGEININKTNDASFDIGTAKLEVNDVSGISQDRIEEFENTATEEGYSIENYLDISLYNSVYKAGLKDENGNYESWDTEVNNLNENASITLELEDDMSGKDLALVHEQHNGNTITGYEIIEATYNSNDNTITFETDSFSNYALISKASTKSKKTYTVVDENGNKATFKEEEGHSYHLNITDYLSFSKEEVIAAAGITSEEYDQIFGGLRKSLKKYGTLVSLYEILLTDENENEITNNPVTIRLKITDKMKKYDTFKLVYVKDDFTLGEVITLKKQGNYLVGELDHLSVYALVGSNSKSLINPQTGDNINLWIESLLISGLGLFTTTITFTRLKKQRVK